jgi:tyrosine-protein kinase Fer
MYNTANIFSVLIDYVETFHSRLKTLAEELIQTQQMLLNKEEVALELEKRIEESSKTCERKSE